VTPWTAATVPIALSVAGHFLFRDDSGHRFRRRLERRRLPHGILDLTELHESEDPDQAGCQR